MNQELRNYEAEKAIDKQNIQHETTVSTMRDLNITFMVNSLNSLVSDLNTKVCLLAKKVDDLEEEIEMMKLSKRRSIDNNG